MTNHTEDVLAKAHAAGMTASATWMNFTQEQSLIIKQNYLPAAISAYLSASEMVWQPIETKQHEQTPAEV